MSRMRGGFAAVLVGAAVVALTPALSAGGPGKLVAKDVGKGKSPVAVPTATIQNPGKLTLVISTKPRKLKVAWGYTTDCYKDGKKYEYPDPGKYEDTISRSKIRRTMNKVVDNPDYCDVAASAKLDYKTGKKVVAKIFNK